MELKQRINWIDYTKGLGILCIMMAHVFQYFKPMGHINAYLCSFHVPVFFVIAGCMDGLFREKRMDVRRRSFQLLIPYICFSCINSIVKFAVLALQGTITSEVLRKEAIEFLFTGNGTVWFLPTIWLLNILTNQIKRMKISVWAILGISITLLAVVYYWNFSVPIISVLVLRMMGALGYWGIGYAYVVIFDIKKYMVGKTLCMLLAGTILFILSEMKIDFFSGVFYNGLVAIPVSVCLSLGYISAMILSDGNEKLGKLLTGLLYLGRNSITIMLVHPLLLQCIMYPLGRMMGKLMGITGVAMAMLVYIVLVLLELPFIRFFNRKCSFMIGKRGI